MELSAQCLARKPSDYVRVVGVAILQRLLIVDGVNKYKAVEIIYLTLLCMSFKAQCDETTPGD